MKNSQTKSAPEPSNNALFDRIDGFLEKNSRLILILCLGLAALFCYLLFDARMSFATDDSEYVLMAANVLKHGSFPTYHGTLYPLCIARLMKLFGFKVALFKAFSALCIVASVYFFYRAFKGRVSYLVLFTTVIYLSINSYFLYFGSQTFSEGLTLCLQSVAFLFFINHIKLLETNPAIKDTIISWLWFGFFFLVLTITKNILIIGVGAAVLYFLIYKEWLNAVLSVASFLVFKIPYELITRAIFHAKTTDQLDQVMRKDFYDPSKGYEDFSGYIDRFFENLNAFVSVQAYKILGIRAENVKEATENGQIQLKDVDPSWILTLIFAGLVVFAFVALYKKNRFLVFSLLYGAAIAVISCAVVQTIWNVQWRLILPYMPYMILPVFGALWIKAKEAKQGFFKPLLIGVMLLFIIIQFPKTSEKVSANSKRIRHCSRWDISCGVEPQYADFVNICDSIKYKVPQNAIIATGKPGEATVYSGMPNFQRLYVNPKPDESADSVLANLKKLGFTHLFMDGVSRQVYGTVNIIGKKYPNKLVPVLQSGTIDPDHPLTLIELKY
jgi:hypothetical protein